MPRELTGAPARAGITSGDGGPRAARELEPMTLEAVFVMVGVIATVISVAALAAALPAGQRPPPRTRPPGWSPPGQLLRIERIVERSAESGLTAHTQLRPLLAEIAAARLARRGVELRRDHDEARRLLGPEAW